MNTMVHRHTSATPAQVWSVLSDGAFYAAWMVGIPRIREIDHDWPQAGTSIRHSVGLWPLLVDDETRSLESKAGLLRLSAPAWPYGRTEIRVSIEKDGDGSAIAMTEKIENVPARWLPSPVQTVVLSPRLQECLNRLAMLAERTEG